MKLPTALASFAVLGVVALTSIRAADTAPKADAWGVVKPAWLTEASLSLKESYDSNIFGVSTNLAGHPDVANQSAWISAASPKLSVNALPLWGLAKDDPLKVLTFGYAGEYSLFSDHHSENNAKHTVAVQLKAQSGPWSFALDNSFLYVDGSRYTTFYNTASAYSSAMPRERRSQIQDRPSLSLRFDADSVFVRGVASAAYFNLLVDRHQPVGAYKGYLNFVNRSDANAGVDFGLKVSPVCSYILGWRVGQQIQARLPWGGTHTDSTYNRLVLGFEGKLMPWLSGTFLVGPDYRRYTDAPNSGIAGASHTWLYAEGSLAATLTKADSLTSTTKVWHWVSSTGNASYQESTYTLAWKHAFDKRLSVSPGLKFLASKYDYPAIRNDQVWAFVMNVSYAVSKELSFSADYLSEDSSSRIPEAIGPGRGFNQNVVSLSVKLAL